MEAKKIEWSKPTIEELGKARYSLGKNCKSGTGFNTGLGCGGGNGDLTSCGGGNGAPGSVLGCHNGNRDLTSCGNGNENITGSSCGNGHRFGTSLS